MLMKTTNPALAALESLLPAALQGVELDQSLIPRIAKDGELMKQLDAALRQVPTDHRLYNADSREMAFLEPNSVHLVVTSPPYWTLKDYDSGEGQLGYVEDYETFLTELDKVWQRCYDALVPGGRLVCVVGDVCLSRRKNKGVHTVVPLHASIQEHCRAMGYANLAPIFWHKITNAVYEAGGSGAFLGKPYEPNAVIKNDIEFILLERKPGAYRSNIPAVVRLMSAISDQNHKTWFQQIWTGVTGASTREHPAPYPVELAERLIRMFSFVGDTVLDPFLGSGSTALAAASCGRNSIGVELSPNYFELTSGRIQKTLKKLPHAQFHMQARYRFAA